MQNAGFICVCCKRNGNKGPPEADSGEKRPFLKRMSAVGGRRKEIKGRIFLGKFRNYSVRKYRIVQDGPITKGKSSGLRAKGQVRNLTRKSCKKRLIPSDGCAIVRVNLLKMYTCICPDDPIRPESCSGGLRGKQRKSGGILKKSFLPLAFFG